MNRLLAANVFRFIILVPLQVLILDKIHFGGYVNPFLYVFFILLLPFETPGWLLLFSSFFIGFMVDLFSGTPGMHSAASVFMAFTRPLVIRSINVNKEFEPGLQPSVRDLGLQWIISYSLVLVFIHHLALFFLEVFRFSGFFDTLQRTILSTIFTVILVIISQYLFMKTSPRR
jgi:rod shape-determining protein MreD